VKLELDPRSGNLIHSFANGEVRVGGATFRDPVIVSIERIITDWSPPPVEKLSLADLQPALELEPEVILLGTGAAQRQPAIVLTTAVLHLGVGIEVMSTAAACRTFNVLASEYRRVAAALFIE
jgi:uncharacterized protein